ncbi:MAG: hypothetical protein FWC40_08650, partial [Proteobacteria bacterium]|nr:hypothetical protein [Pseudomonadota bacterium]
MMKVNVSSTSPVQQENTPANPQPAQASPPAGYVADNTALSGENLLGESLLHAPAPAESLPSAPPTSHIADDTTLFGESLLGESLLYPTAPAQSSPNAPIKSIAPTTDNTTRPAKTTLSPALAETLEPAETTSTPDDESINGNLMRVPGRMPIMPLTLLQMLFSVIALTAGTVHFSLVSTNYLFPLAVLQIVLFAQIFLYHSSFRAQRQSLAIIHILMTLGMVAVVDWALLDLILYPPTADIPHHFLYLAIWAFTMIPLT